MIPFGFEGANDSSGGGGPPPPPPSFTPVTNTYTTGTNALETIPSGASQVVITVDGGGASAATVADGSLKGGAGAGARAVRTVTGLVGGQTFRYTVANAVPGHTGGSLGSGTAGEASTVTSESDTHGIGMTAHGGSPGTTTLNGQGGNATGGTTNTNGGDASNGSGGDGVAGPGGVGGNSGNSGTAPSGGGASGDTTGAVGGGSGARGQVSFAYT